MTETQLTQAFEQVLETQNIRPVFQPIIHLASEEVVGYEALARGPYGSELENPHALFQMARKHDRVSDLDWICRKAAFQGALTAGLGPPFALFVNFDPESLARPLPIQFAEIWQQAEEHLQVVVEVTETSLTAAPAEMIRTLMRMRERGWAIALDDVGADPTSLALLPFVAPDIIKLDLRLVQGQPSAHIAEVVGAVNAEAERTGATVLAEGVEDQQHLFAAKALGATLGQGWLWGKAEPLPSVRKQPVSSVALPDVNRVVWPESPFRDIGMPLGARVANKTLLHEMSRLIERQALALGESMVVLSCYKNYLEFEAVSGIYHQLARSAALVGVFAYDMPPYPAPGVRGICLEAGDALQEEWNTVVIGPHFACALLSKYVGNIGPGAEPCFDFVLTYNRERVIQAAGSMISRVREMEK